MLVAASRDDLQRIVILNPKGGCGKTSLAVSLASHYAQQGPMPALLDCDPQGASMRWLEKRSTNRPPIYGIAAYRQAMNATRSWQLRVPRETCHLIVDTPAGLGGADIHELVYDATSVLIPILPSAIDIRAAARFIAELLLYAQLDRARIQVGIVTNRTRANTLSLRQLMRFVNSLQIPIIANLRDSQNFVTAVDQGLGIDELPRHRAERDVAELGKIVSWLDRWRAPIRDRAENPSVQEDAHGWIAPL